jgi:hypothetical protein
MKDANDAEDFCGISHSKDYQVRKLMIRFLDSRKTYGSIKTEPVLALNMKFIKF